MAAKVRTLYRELLVVYLTATVDAVGLFATSYAFCWATGIEFTDATPLWLIAVAAFIRTTGLQRRAARLERKLDP